MTMHVKPEKPGGREQRVWTPWGLLPVGASTAPPAKARPAYGARRREWLERMRAKKG